jgi:hypothetical protein
MKALISLLQLDPTLNPPTNNTYVSGLNGLRVSFHAAIFGNVWFSMNYSLDGKENETVALREHYFGFFKQTGGQPEKNYLDGFVELPILCNGSHSLTVYLRCEWETWDATGSHMHTSFNSQTIHFTVLSPIVLLMQNSYNSTEVPVDFYANWPCSQIVYDLDNQASATITGNATLTGLNEGTHSVNIYSLEDKGNWVGFDTAAFNVTKLPPSPSLPFLMLNYRLLTLSASIVVIAGSLLLLSRKRKQPARR